MRMDIEAIISCNTNNPSRLVDATIDIVKAI